MEAGVWRDRRVRAHARPRGADLGEVLDAHQRRGAVGPLRRREAEPLKQWKLTAEDWRNRDKNRDYDAAAEDVFAHTDHELAPWDAIAAEQKRFGRVAVLERLNERIEAGMRRWGFPVPEHSV